MTTLSYRMALLLSCGLAAPGAASATLDALGALGDGRMVVALFHTIVSVFGWLVTVAAGRGWLSMRQVDFNVQWEGVVDGE